MPFMTKRAKNITLSDEARAWAEGTTSASAYIDGLLLERSIAFSEATETLSHLSRPQLLAAIELSGLVTPAAEVFGKWGITPQKRKAITAMPEAEVVALRVIIEEHRQGRSLD